MIHVLPSSVSLFRRLLPCPKSRPHRHSRRCRLQPSLATAPSRTVASIGFARSRATSAVVPLSSSTAGTVLPRFAGELCMPAVYGWQCLLPWPLSLSFSPSNPSHLLPKVAPEPVRLLPPSLLSAPRRSLSSSVRPSSFPPLSPFHIAALRWAPPPLAARSRAAIT